MTLPTLIQKHQEKVTVTQLKKSYSILSQALNFAIAENGTVDNWKMYTFEEDRGEDEGSVEMTIFEPYNLTKNLKFSKDCGFKADGCFIDNGYEHLNGAKSRNFEKLTRYYKGILADGTAIALQGYNVCGNVTGHCGEIWVDVNGHKKPNVVGKDVFLFIFTKNKLVPYKATDRASSIYNGPLSKTQCRFQEAGYDCANWVMTYENLDYLHCDDLSYSGKTKCK